MTKRAPVLTSALLFALSASAQATTPATTPTPQTTNTATPASAPADPPMPKDPNALMQLAARVNGLGSPDMKPWHLKANYQTFDADGKPKEQGVFEEWWAAPDKYKISYTSPSFNQVQYRNGKDTLATGDANWPSTVERMAEQWFVQPMPAADADEKLKYVAVNAKDAGVALDCIHPVLPSGYVVGLSFCFGKDIPAVRIEAPYGQFLVFFNDIVRSDGHYVAKDVRILKASKPYLNEDVTLLEFLPAIEDSAFVAPSGATTMADQSIVVSPAMLAGHKIGGDIIKYPAIARAARVQGRVVLSAEISKNGDIDELKVISGPPMLIQAAEDAVYTWRYKPYLLNGQPVAVKTQINVDFTLGRR